MTNDPYECLDEDRVDAYGIASESMPRWSSSRMRWGTFLAVSSIAGNTTIPWLMDDLIPALNRALSRSYGLIWSYDYFFVLYGFGAGLVIAQCVAVWLVCNAYLPSRSGRLLIGSFVNILVITSWIIGMTSSVGRKPPVGTAILLLGGGTMIYLLVGWVLGTLLNQTRSGWRQTASGSNNQFSLRTLLGAMIAVAVIALISKWIPDNQRGLQWLPLGELTGIILFLVCFALAISCLVWLQYKALRGEYKTISWVWFLSYLALGPIVFLCVSCVVIEWGKYWQDIFTMKFVSLAYAIHLGIVTGIGLVMPVLPRSDRSKVSVN
ncbi:MAG: hypothetical protein ACK5LQ_03985 [Planctomycetota bacterium]